MCFYPDRAHARPPAPMGNAKGLVQIQVAHIAANITRSYQAHHGVHIGAIDIHLTAVLVGNVADLGHRFFKDTMGGWVCDHAGR